MGTKRKYKIRVNESTTVDGETGEIVMEKQSQISTYAKEPDYVKTYFSDIGRLHGLAPQMCSVLWELVKMMNYENQIVVSVGVKQIICEVLDIRGRNGDLAINVVDVYLSKLCTKNILIRGKKGIYYANPNLFGRGAWQQISEIRMKITYNDSEGRTIQTEKK